MNGRVPPHGNRPRERARGHRSFTACLLSCFLPLILTDCHRSRKDGLIALIEDNGPSYLFTDPARSTADPFAIRNAIVREIDGANDSVDFWFYELDDTEIASALKRARNRGLRLNLTGSGDQVYAELEAMGIRPAIRPQAGLQHAKLLMLDRRIIISGTGNFTRSCMFYNNNVFFRSRVDQQTGDRIISAMSDERTHHQPIVWRDGAARIRMIPSPSAGNVIQSVLTQAVLDAHTSVRFLIFSFTDAALGGAMIRRSREGLPIEGVFESYGSLMPEADSLLYNMSRMAGFAPFFLYADGNEHIFFDAAGTAHGGKLHHKTMIVDDSIVYTGSFNWSINARDSNREAFFEIMDPIAPALFGQNFDEIRRNAMSVPRPPSDPSPGATLRGTSPCEAPAPTGGSDPSFEMRIVHTGHGAFFRGLILSGRDCTRAGNASAGFERSTSFALPVPDGPILTDFRSGRFENTTGVVLPSAFLCANSQCDPCAAGRCQPIHLKRISFQAGWAKIEAPAPELPVSEIWIWHQGGMERRTVQRVDDDLLLFAPVSPAPGGALLFLSASQPQDRLGIACAFGSVPEAASTFLDSLAWFYPQSFAEAMRCTAPD